MAAQVFVQVRRPAAEIEQRARRWLRPHDAEHYGMALGDILGTRPVDAAVRVAVAGEAVLVMRDEAMLGEVRQAPPPPVRAPGTRERNRSAAVPPPRPRSAPGRRYAGR